MKNIEGLELQAKSELLKLQIKRVSEGLELQAKSEILNKWAEGLSEGKLQSLNWGIEAHKMNTIPFQQEAYRLDMLGSNTLLDDDKYPNISYIRATSLRDGVTIVLKGVFSAELVDQYAIAVKHAIASLYKGYIKQKKINITITEEI